MIYILKDRIIRIEWTILKGTSHVREDFRRANVKVFLIGNTEKYYLEATAEDGILKFDIPQGLEEGTYGIEAIWVKNEGHLGMGNRSISRSKKERLFSITEFEEEATNMGEGEVVLKVKSSTATYGYDGLSSYELAVLRGEWTGTEGEWLKHQRYVSVLDGRGDSETDTMSQKSITDELEAHDEAIEANKKAIEANKKEFDEYTEETDDRLDDVEERLDYIPKESFLSSDPAAGFNTSDVIEEDYVADRAISDRFGRRIDEEYVTRESVKNYTQEVVDGSKLEIMPGSVVPESLSPAVKQMIEAGAGKPGSITNLPDEEDITVTDANTLQFKDKEYNPYNYSGMGRVYLRKHIVNGTNVLAQHMINKPNTIYVIQYDYCLAEQTIEIPENCVLRFEGGSLRNGVIFGNNTIINSGLNKIFNFDLLLKGYFINTEYNAIWFGILPNIKYIDSVINKATEDIKNTGGGNLIFENGYYYCNSTIWLRHRVGIVGKTNPNYYYPKSNSSIRFIFEKKENNDTYWWAFDSDVYDNSNNRFKYNYFHTKLSGETDDEISAYNLSNIDIITNEAIFGGIRLISSQHSNIENIIVNNFKVGMYITSSWHSNYKKIILNTLIHGIVLAVEITTELFESVQCTRRTFNGEYLIPEENDCFGLDLKGYLYRPDIDNSHLLSYGLISYRSSVTFNNFTAERYNSAITCYGPRFLLNTPYFENLDKFVIYQRGGAIIEINPIGSQPTNYTEYEEYSFNYGAVFKTYNTSIALKIKDIGFGTEPTEIEINYTRYNITGKYLKPLFYNNNNILYVQNFDTVYVSNTSDNLGFGFYSSDPITIEEAIKRICTNINYRNIKNISLIDDITNKKNLGELKELNIKFISNDVLPKKLTFTANAVDCKFEFNNIDFELNNYEANGLWHIKGKSEFIFNNCFNDVALIRALPECDLVLKENNKRSENSIYLFNTIHSNTVHDVTFTKYINDELMTKKVVNDISEITSINNYGNNAIIYALNTNTYYTVTSNSKGLLLIPYNRSIKKFSSNEFCGSERPTLSKYDNGFQYYDTTLNKPIWWTGEKWVDATGAEV